MPTVEELRFTHPEYDRSLENWLYTGAHYDAEELYRSIGKYVPQKEFGESDEAYNDRLTVTAYLPILAAVLDSVVGGVARKETETEREWGLLENRGFAEQLQQDADLRGTSWSHFQLDKLTSALTYRKMYVLVDTTLTDGSSGGNRPYVKTIKPTSFVNWQKNSKGQLVEAMIREKVDVREDIFGDPSDAEREQFLHLTLEGHQRHRIVEDEEGEISVESDPFVEWDEPWKNRSGDVVIPIVETRPTLRRYAAFELARLANEILNIGSELRYILRFGGIGQYLVLALGDEEFDKMVTRIRRQGTKAIQEDPENGGNSRFIGPDADVLEGLIETLRAKIEWFWQAAMFEFSDQAVERTATEIESDFLSSLGAFLASLAEAADDSENEELWLLAQAVSSGQTLNPNDKNIPHVRRSKEFTTSDALTVAMKIRDVVRGQNKGLVTTPEIEALVTMNTLDKLGLFEGLEDPEATFNELMERAEIPVMEDEPDEDEDDTSNDE